MIKFIRKVKFVGMCMIFGIISSCISTETIEEPTLKEEESSEEISIKLSSPEAVNTRADDHDGYVLRYSAMLYTKNGQSVNKESLQRKEIVENENGTNIITFTAKSGKYVLYVFADYIPKGSEPNDDGLYDDYYYDTHSYVDKIRMKIYKDNGEIPEDFFNNENYDCFSIYRGDLEKGDKRLPVQIILSRATSKIVFKDKSAQEGSVVNVKFSDFSYFPEFAPEQNTAFEADPDIKSKQLENINLECKIENEVLFYFYSFGPDYSGRNLMSDLSFTTLNADGKPQNINIDNEKLIIRRNYITTIHGYFISQLSAKDDEIELDFKGKEDWGNEDGNDPVYEVILDNQD